MAAAGGEVPRSPALLALCFSSRHPVARRASRPVQVGPGDRSRLAAQLELAARAGRGPPAAGGLARARPARPGSTPAHRRPDGRVSTRSLGAGHPLGRRPWPCPGARTILLRADQGDLARTLRHELAHLALHEAVTVRVPLWFDEGYAAWAAGEWDRLGGARAQPRGGARARCRTLTALDGALRGSASTADAAYALAAVGGDRAGAAEPDRDLDAAARPAGGGRGLRRRRSRNHRSPRSASSSRNGSGRSAGGTPWQPG